MWVFTSILPRFHNKNNDTKRIDRPCFHGLNLYWKSKFGELLAFYSMSGFHPHSTLSSPSDNCALHHQLKLWTFIMVQNRKKLWWGSKTCPPPPFSLIFEKPLSCLTKYTWKYVHFNQKISFKTFSICYR